MEKDFMSKLQWRDALLPNVTSTELQFDLGLQSKAVSMNLNCPVQGLALPPRDEEPHSWFHCFPQLRPSFISGAKMALDEKLLYGTDHSKPLEPTTTRCNPKQFLVFDRSGDRTTLIYSPMTGDASVYMNSNLRNNNPNASKMEILSETCRLSGPNLSDELNAKDSEDEEWNNAHEDTEEINALLYSDDESDHDENYDDEETSTGHSPCVMTAEKDLKDVASSGGCAKRRRISQDEHESQSLMDTASSAMADRSRTLQFEVHDAESKLADDHVQWLKGNSTDTNKRSRIRETVEILQRIVPGARGKGSMAVLEESIRYLRSLKEKAECSGFVGLDAFSAA